MKRILPLSQRMWIFFGMQLLFTFMITATLAGFFDLFLHRTQELNQKWARVLPTETQKLDAEEDPAKLREKAKGLLKVITMDDQFQEIGLHFAVTLSLAMGFGLFIYSAGMGISAYQVQK